MEWVKDDTGEIKRYADKLIEKYFKELKFATILYAWGDEKVKDEEIIMAETIKLNNINRDLFGYDFVMVVYKSSWDKLNEKEKHKLIFHELCHCFVETRTAVNTETGEVSIEPAIDKDGRVRIKLNKHDIELKRFSSELKKFGLNQDEILIMEFLNKVYKKVNLKRKSKEENE